MNKFDEDALAQAHRIFAGAAAAQKEIDEILADHERKQRVRALPAAEQAEARRQVNRNRITMDLHPAVTAALKTTAQRIGVAPARLADAVLAAGLMSIHIGTFRVDPYLVPSRSNRWDWTIDIDSSEYLRTLEKIGGAK